MMQYWSMILFQRTQATNSNHLSCFSPLLHAPATARTQLATTCRSAEIHYPDASQPTANYSLLTANSSFTFSAKERDPETGLSYFGSRYYSSDLGIWLSVDPQSDKYASLSPYVYCADNPVKLVDPNGEDIEIFTKIDEDGNKIITINFTAKIVNNSSHRFNKSKMEKMKDEISAGIITYFSGKYDDATVNVNVDIICNNEEKSDDFWKEENRHSIFIVDKCSNPRWIAEAEECGSYMNIRWNIGRGTNDNNLKRTAAHEFGHLLGLPDVNIEGNLMKPGGTGVDVTWRQIQKAVSNYSQHRINNGILMHFFENHRYNHH